VFCLECQLTAVVPNYDALCKLWKKSNFQRETSQGLMHVAAWHRQTPESKFYKFGEEMSIGQIPNDAKFCGYLKRSV